MQWDIRQMNCTNYLITFRNLLWQYLLNIFLDLSHDRGLCGDRDCGRVLRLLQGVRFPALHEGSGIQFGLLMKKATAAHRFGRRLSFFDRVQEAFPWGSVIIRIVIRIAGKSGAGALPAPDAEILRIGGVTAITFTAGVGKMIAVPADGIHRVSAARAAFGRVGYRASALLASYQCHVFSPPFADIYEFHEKYSNLGLRWV